MLRRFIVRPTSSVFGARGIAMTVPRYAPKTVPPLLEKAFTQERYEQLLKKIPDWDQYFVGWPSYTINSTLVAAELPPLKTPAMANAILAYFDETTAEATDPLKMHTPVTMSVQWGSLWELLADSRLAFEGAEQAEYLDLLKTNKYRTIEDVMDEESPVQFAALSKLPGRDARKIYNLVMAEATDPLNILLEAKEKHDAAEWDFAHPVPPAGTVNEAVMDTVVGEPARDVADNINLSAEPKGALLLAVQAGMGIGKSHVCDTIQEYVFQGEDPLVLKVTYNRGQEFETEAERPAAGLLARLVLAVERRVPPTASRVVQRALAADAHAAEDRRLTVTRVAQYVLEKADGRPVIVAVDELASLSSDESALKKVLSGVAAFIKAVYKALGSQAKALGLVTALPHTDITSLSDRQPKFVTPVALTNDESRTLLQAGVGADVPGKDQEQISLLCGGHPRSLAVAASLYSTTKSVPLPAEVASRCSWKVQQGSGATVVAAALADAYRGGDDSIHGAMKRVDATAMLVTRGDRHVLPPTVLFSDQGTSRSLRHIRAIYTPPTGEDNTKLLEHIHRHWEYFKAEQELPVVPPAMRKRVVVPPAQQQSKHSFDPSQLTFHFEHRDEPNDACVLERDGGLHKDFLAIDPFAYYCPKNVGHPKFESMCVASVQGAPGGARVEVLCLFQSKINDRAVEAVHGLNSAAKDLQRVWPGPFLFVVLALGASKGQIAAAKEETTWPTLLVNEDSLADYFTATLSPAAELCLSRHRAKSIKPQQSARR